MVKKPGQKGIVLNLKTITENSPASAIDENFRKIQVELMSAINTLNPIAEKLNASMGDPPDGKGNDFFEYIHREIARAKENIKKAEEELRKTEKRLNDSEMLLNDTRQQLQEAEERLSERQRQIEAVQEQLASQQEYLENVTLDISTTLDDFWAQKENKVYKSPVDPFLNSKGILIEINRSVQLASGEMYNLQINYL